MIRARIIRALLRAWHLSTLRRTKIVDFLGHKLVLTSATFDPRYAVSTTLITRVAQRLTKRSYRVLELGCGSGAVSIAIASYCNRVVCYDIDPRCIAVARINASINGVNNAEFTRSPDTVLKMGPYDMILSNPPYLPLNPSDTRDLAWCCGETHTALAEILDMASRVAKRGTLLLITCSSVTPLGKCVELASTRGFKFIDRVCKRTPFDEVCVLIFVHR